MGLKQVICCLPHDVHKDLALVDEIEGGDTEIIVQEQVPSVIHEDRGKKIQGKRRTAPRLTL
jgi:hypothetical protein